MKCSNCWSRRIAEADANLLHRMLAALLLMKPVKCRHCFHAFYVPLWSPRSGEPDGSSHLSAEEQHDAESVIVPFKKADEERKSQGKKKLCRKAA